MKNNKYFSEIDIFKIMLYKHTFRKYMLFIYIINVFQFIYIYYNIIINYYITNYCNIIIKFEFNLIVTTIHVVEIIELSQTQLFLRILIIESHIIFLYN